MNPCIFRHFIYRFTINEQSLLLLLLLFYLFSSTVVSQPVDYKKKKI